MACETIAETKEPLSRQSLADLVRRSRETLGKKISRSTVWRMLHEAAIKPWQYEHWLFPKDPRFAEKAGPILDLYAGQWEGQPLGPKDYVVSMDEKTSIQARGRTHEEMPPEPEQTRRIESEYERNGALQYLAAWDVHRGMIMGRCEKKTGIEPFGLLVDQVLAQAPYKDATRLFFIVDNGSSHRGQASVERMRRRDQRIVLVHTPIHASWLNQVDRAVWPAGGSGAGTGAVQGRNEVVFHCGQWVVASRPGIGGAHASARPADRIGAYADPCELAESGGDLFLDHPEKGADAERFRDAGSSPGATGVVRGAEQPHAATVCVEVHSTRHAGLAKTCVAAFFSSFRCVGKRNRATTTLFVKRTTKTYRVQAIGGAILCP